jgi:hypothetical protein
MAPIAVTPESSNASPNGDILNGFFHRDSNGLSNGINGHSNGAANGHANGGVNGHRANGWANGSANGHTNGHTNGHANDHTNGHSDGHTNGHSNGHSNGLTNGHANGVNGYTNGYANGVNSDSESFSDPPKVEPIAIVGMACRLPGNVATPGEFWELCTRARTGWTEIPKERFNNGSFYHPNAGKGGCQNAVGGNFLNVDLAAFDAPFFGLTEKEAISMDPQQRLLLECTFEALESAGIPKHTIVGKDVGVFVGGSFPEYESHLFRDSDSIPMHQATGLSTLTLIMLPCAYKV